jgi:hypothetical protein
MNIKKINEILIKVILGLILTILTLYLRLDCCVGLSFEEYCFMDQYSISKDIERVEILTKEQQHLMEEINEFATAHTKRVEQANKIQNQLKNIQVEDARKGQEKIYDRIFKNLNPVKAIKVAMLTGMCMMVILLGHDLLMYWSYPPGYGFVNLARGRK